MGRACGLRKENLMYRAVEINQQQDTETIRLLQEISSKLDEKNNRGCHYGIYKKTTLGKLLKP